MVWTITLAVIQTLFVLSAGLRANYYLRDEEYMKGVALFVAAIAVNVYWILGYTPHS